MVDHFFQFALYTIFVAVLVVWRERQVQLQLLEQIESHLSTWEDWCESCESTTPVD